MCYPHPLGERRERRPERPPELPREQTIAHPALRIPAAAMRHQEPAGGKLEDGTRRRLGIRRGSRSHGARRHPGIRRRSHAPRTPLRRCRITVVGAMGGSTLAAVAHPPSALREALREAVRSRMACAAAAALPLPPARTLPPPPPLPGTGLCALTMVGSATRDSPPTVASSRYTCRSRHHAHRLPLPPARRSRRSGISVLTPPRAPPRARPSSASPDLRRPRRPPPPLMGPRAVDAAQRPSSKSSRGWPVRRLVCFPARAQSSNRSLASCCSVRATGWARPSGGVVSRSSRVFTGRGAQGARSTIGATGVAWCCSTPLA